MSETMRSEFPLTRRPAILVDKPSRLGTLTLETLTDGSVLQLLGQQGKFSADGAKAALGPQVPSALRAAGPGQWFLVSEAALNVDDVSARLAGLAYVVDQSHGRSRMRIQGENVMRLLAKGTGVDLHKDAFPVGHATMTLIGHIGVNLARTAEDAFELLVLRGFAEGLWHEIHVMGAEFT